MSTHRPNRVVLVALFASVGLNVLAGGALVRLALEPSGPPETARFVDKMARSLPDADARILRQVFTEQGADLITPRQPGEPDPFHVALDDVLTREPFEPEAMAAVFDRFDARHKRMQGILIEAASKMTPEGRRAMACFRP